MKRYLFLLGRKSELALAELYTVISREEKKAGKITLTPLNHTVIIETKTELDIQSLINTLGGTVKIATLGEKATVKNFIEKLLTVLRNESIGKGKLVFGISTVGSREEAQKFLIPKTLKDRLSNENIASRYVLPSKSDELSSSQVSLADLTELYVVWLDSEIEIGKTIETQDFRGFSYRDYQRPFSDPKEGMLPLKVARMMLNLAFTKPLKSTLWVLDPFCGSGTIAMEAMMLGINSISSDHSQKKVIGTKKNLQWLIREEKLNTNWQVFQSDATKVSKNLPRKVDAVVTEPYLGPVKLTVEKIPDIVKGLNKLYLGAIKDWRALLKSKGRVVMVLPEFNVDAFVKRADLVIDRCENLGYTLVAGPFEYDRPQTKVKRLIIVLQNE